MLLHEDPNTSKFKINGYAKDTLIVNEVPYHNSIIIGIDKIITAWKPDSLPEVKNEHLMEILSFKSDIILLGTGQRFIMPPSSQLRILHEHNKSLECMDTTAACRTYIALTSEGRNVVAALLIK